jgi:predicted house-cleaning noncanonical NTP pyrophosphatase (MazG superfamily)
MRDYPVKLVRDRIPEELGEGVTSYQPLLREDHIRELRKKLVEEVAEYLVDPSIGELADIYEVIKTLSVVDVGDGWMAVEEAAHDKYNKRGGFLRGMVMINVAGEDGCLES